MLRQTQIIKQTAFSDIKIAIDYLFRTGKNKAPIQNRTVWLPFCMGFTNKFSKEQLEKLIEDCDFILPNMVGKYQLVFFPNTHDMPTFKQILDENKPLLDKLHVEGKFLIACEDEDFAKLETYKYTNYMAINRQEIDDVTKAVKSLYSDAEIAKRHEPYVNEFLSRDQNQWCARPDAIKHVIRESMCTLALMERLREENKNDKLTIIFSDEHLFQFIRDFIEQEDMAKKIGRNANSIKPIKLKFIDEVLKGKKTRHSKRNNQHTSPPVQTYHFINQKLNQENKDNNNNNFQLSLDALEAACKGTAKGVMESLLPLYKRGQLSIEEMANIVGACQKATIFNLFQPANVGSSPSVLQLEKEISSPKNTLS